MQPEVFCGEEGFVSRALLFMLLRFSEAGGSRVNGWEVEPAPSAGRAVGHKERHFSGGTFSSPGQEGAHRLAC